MWQSARYTTLPETRIGQNQLAASVLFLEGDRLAGGWVLPIQAGKRCKCVSCTICACAKSVVSVGSYDSAVDGATDWKRTCSNCRHTCVWSSVLSVGSTSKIRRCGVPHCHGVVATVGSDVGLSKNSHVPCGLDAMMLLCQSYGNN